MHWRACVPLLSSLRLHRHSLCLLSRSSRPSLRPCPRFPILSLSPLSLLVTSRQIQALSWTVSGADWRDRPILGSETLAPGNGLNANAAGVADAAFVFVIMQVAGSFRLVMVAGRRGFSVCDPRAGEAI